MKFGEPEIIAMDNAIGKGHAVSRSDFIRSAVREKLKTIGEA